MMWPSLKGTWTLISRYNQACSGFVPWPQSSLWSPSTGRFCKISWRWGQVVFRTYLPMFTQWEPEREGGSVCEEHVHMLMDSS